MNRPAPVLGLALTLSLAGAWLGPAAAARAEMLVLRGATLHPVDGPEIADGTLVVDGGRIVGLGTGLPVPADARVVELAGKHVYPGFILPATPLGLIEVASVRGTNDTKEIDALNAQLRSEVAFNADSQLLLPAMAGGVLTAHVVSSGGQFAGSTAAMRLAGWNWEQMTLAAPVAMNLYFPEVTRPTAGEEVPKIEDFDKAKKKELDELDQSVAAARAYDVARRAAEAGTGPAVEIDARYEALRPVLAGKLPILLHASERNQLEQALDWAAKQGLGNLIVIAGPDAQYLAERLAREKRPLILDGVLDLPRRSWEPYDSTYAAAAKLHAAGVELAIGDGGDAANSRNLPFHAAMAAAFGLPKDVALASVTLEPAKILGLANRLGSLAVGKDATFFVADGDPLEIRTHIERVWVQGEEIDLTRDRQRQLWERYRARPKPAP
jgi:imidazolonepropionase-like amidohydrolase